MRENWRSLAQCRPASDFLQPYKAAWSARISHCPLPLTFQIGAAAWNVGEIPTDGITPPFSNVTKALEVIPSKIKNPFCRRFPKNPYAEDANELDVNLHRGLLAIT